VKLRRRQFLHLAASAAALPVFSRITLAQSYPMRPVHVIVGFPAGSGPDITARLMAQWNSEHLGQSFVIENRPGAASNIATELVVRASPDGYTLLTAVTSNAINATFYDNLNFNFVRDIAPVAGMVRSPYVIVVNPSVPAKTVLEFIAYAKANPGKINMGSSGNGSTPHLYGELFKTMAGVDLLHVPYRGNYLPDLLAGQVQVAFAPLPSSIEFIRAGKLRALAVTTAARLDVLPDVPTVGDFLPGYEASSWTGITAPRNTPVDIIDKLNKAINAGLADAKIRERLADLGGLPMPMTPAEFGKFIVDETEKWGKVIRAANIKPE
jgi:tripartite-type tricarboxylate transporter receptor subunit TctC